MSVITCRSNILRGARELSKRRPMEALYNYLGGTTGSWRVTDIATRSGQPLKPVTHIGIVNGPLERLPAGTAWVLRGVVSNTRYVMREERDLLQSRQPPLNRTEATCAALIPIRKSPQWWSLAQDERREILETRSRHIATGLRFLPAIARLLQHGRDLGEQFDFVTWFEYAPQDSAAFDRRMALHRTGNRYPPRTGRRLRILRYDIQRH
jgi:chlorite dismutase